MNGYDRFLSFCLAMAAMAVVMAPDPGLARSAQDQPATGAASSPSDGSQQLFALIYRPGPKWRPGKPFREQIAIMEHFAYMKGLFAKGQVFSAGGMGSDHGLVLFHARDQAEAEAVMAADPMIKAGSFTGEVRSYAARFLSDQPLTRTKK